jgi:hypothetical protein
MHTMTTTTSRCTEHGHPEFRLSHEENLQLVEDVRTLAARLERQVADGHRFSDGDTLPIGWLHCRIRSAADGLLTVWEPDMVFYPPLWVEGINHAVIHFKLQSGVVASLDGDHSPAFPGHTDLAWVSDDLGESDRLVMQRLDAEAGHSGWSLTGDEPRGQAVPVEQLRTLSVYEVVTRLDARPIPHLALPVGARVELGAGPPRITLHDEPVGVTDGSLLASTFDEA